jgi:hypothetical protein
MTLVDFYANSGCKATVRTQLDEIRQPDMILLKCIVILQKGLINEEALRVLDRFL